jgi:uncharacterized membrane protein required for colicin V production
MFAAIMTKLETPPSPGNWFDGVVLVMLMIGIIRGRKRGMSEEVLSLLQVLTVIVVCGHYHQPLGKFFADFAPTTVVFANVFVYVTMLLVIVILFSAVKRVVGEKLVGSDLFGRLEYYLGMVAGAVRYFGYVLIFMALVNAPHYTAAEIMAAAKAQNDSLGSDFFPSSFGEVQTKILKESLTGHLVRLHLSTVLIESVPSTPPPAPKRELPKDRKARELEKTYK